MKKRLKALLFVLTFTIMASSVGMAASAASNNKSITPHATASGCYPGFDTSIYPGDTAMSNFWHNTPFYFTGFYLGPAPMHSNTSWMSKRSYLEGLGYGLLVLYVGRQAGSSSLTYAQGQADGANAASLAAQAGFSKTYTRIYLDVEEGGLLGSSFTNYIQGWIDYIANNTIYHAGIYCSYYSTASQIKALDTNASNATYYVFNINEPPSPGNTTSTGSLTPTSSKVSFATTWQYNQNGYQTFNGTTLNVDLDLSSMSNPSLTR